MNRYNIGNPFLAWSVVSLKTWEMLFASSQVISHRSTRIAAAGANPGARDRREIALMWQEKIEAFTLAGQVMAVRMLAINQQLGALVLRQMTGVAGRAMSQALNPALALTGRRQAKLLRSTMVNWAAAASKLNGASAQLAQQALKPIHSRATGNAKRLLGH